jgi:Ribosomal silencing factor during starvation
MLAAVSNCCRAPTCVASLGRTCSPRSRALFQISSNRSLLRFNNHHDSHYTPRRFLNSATSRSDPLEQRDGEDQNFPKVEAKTTAMKSNSDPQGQPSNAGDSEPVPWYLQTQSFMPPAQEMTDRQKLPELPEHSPSILEPMLKHISVTLGIDYLRVLDLRSMDPPPALGANLMMIIGTARSERHLHVSADRLCRHLRTDFNLTPFADGLLGRNELKMKLRRKAKKARLLGSSGGSEFSQDDGIRTGWVCINVGMVDTKSSLSSNFSPVGIEGFGSQSDGARLVVQLMTDEKREELDLENLWLSRLKKRAKEISQAVDTVRDDNSFETDSLDRKAATGTVYGEGSNELSESK